MQLLNQSFRSSSFYLWLLETVLSLFSEWAWICLVWSKHCLVSPHPSCATCVHHTTLEIWWRETGRFVVLQFRSGNSLQACSSSLGEFKVEFKLFCCSCWTGEKRMKTDPLDELMISSSWPFFALHLWVKLLTLSFDSESKSQGINLSFFFLGQGWACKSGGFQSLSFQTGRCLCQWCFWHCPPSSQVGTHCPSTGRTAEQYLPWKHIKYCPQGVLISFWAYPTIIVLCLFLSSGFTGGSCH